MSAPPVAVHADDLVVRYGRRTALAGVSLTVRAGERVAVLGPSGAGKSTLLGVLAGVVRPTSGRVRVLGGDLGTLRPAELRRMRSRIGAVHQQLHLVGPLRVVHNVNAGRLGRWSGLRALCSLARPQGLAEARAALHLVGLADRLHDRTDTLSGGQQQRVALARLIAQAPDLILADEPVSALDPALAEEVMELLATVLTGHGRTLVAGLHDAASARRWCDRVIGLAGGAVVFDLPSGQVTPDRTAALYTGAR
jgi:phosphonate transport system ATP-binding protein